MRQVDNDEIFIGKNAYKQDLSSIIFEFFGINSKAKDKFFAKQDSKKILKIPKDVFNSSKASEILEIINSKNPKDISKLLSFEEFNPKILICNKDEIREIVDVFLFLDIKYLILPSLLVAKNESFLSYYDEVRSLFSTLCKWYDSKDVILISPIETLLLYLPSKAHLKMLSLELYMTISPRNLSSTLIDYGFNSVEIVELAGEFSSRGDIFDIAYMDEQSLKAIRISFFGDDIESIKELDLQTQLCNKLELEKVLIPPTFAILNEEEKAILEERIDCIKDYLHKKDIASFGMHFLEDVGGVNFLESYEGYFTPLALSSYKEILNLREQTSKSDIFALSTNTIFSSFKQDLGNLKTFLNLHKEKNTTLLCLNEARLKAYELEGYSYIKTSSGLNILSSKALIASLNIPSVIQKAKRAKIDISTFKAGDYVVHADYGVGIFEGIKQVSVLGATKDFVSIMYQNEDRLLLLVENLNLLEKSTLSINKLDSLGKKSFARLKASIKQKLLVIAKDIINLQAKRELNKGVIIDIDTPTNLVQYARFEEKRGFTLTRDQQKVITDSFLDLKSGNVMDRLLSGDVGFGKTEVALCLCFGAYLSGYKSVLIAPTTLLVRQHFESFTNRFKDFNIKIAKLERFTTQRQKLELKKDLEDGNIDILIGTHAIFSVNMSNLGIIIVDEEHKFGVKQKELLKQKSISSHILSMSATPIPRTLSLAYGKLKSISTLLTPPSFKIEPKTFLRQKDDILIKEVILRELKRGGQVFYIFNNIAKINNIKSYLLSLLPTLRILVLHSEISKKQTDDGMLEFMERKHDLLLCTSIIESGIHLPNANTIIIDNAQNFGIADLHQLRGRVGRGKAQSFCYLLVKKDEEISQSASKRLLALEKNSFLGSGEALAHQDLEIRGSGNLLGESQSGHIKQIGLGLYTKMLEECLNELSFKTSPKDSKIDLNLSVSAFLNEQLINSETLRLELYKRLSKCNNKAQVLNITEEIYERFGKPDNYTLAFLEVIQIKVLALHKQIKAISNYSSNITLTNIKDEKIYIKANSKDDDDILECIKSYLNKMD